MDNKTNNNFKLKDGIYYGKSFSQSLGKDIKEDDTNILYKNLRILKDNGTQIQEFIRKRD